MLALLFLLAREHRPEHRIETIEDSNFSSSKNALDAQGWELDPASRVNSVLVKLKGPNPGPSTFVLTEDEINAWAQVAIQSKKRLGIQALVLDLRDGGKFQAEATINMDEVLLESLSVQLFQDLLKGDQNLVVIGSLSCSQGKGTAAVKEAHINDVLIPAFLVDAVIGYLSQNQPPHLDLTEPFDLPFGIQKVRILAGRVVIVTYPPMTEAPSRRP